ncbi:MAG: fused MFS/spermidine synthase [Planctomycetota bacterium]
MSQAHETESAVEAPALRGGIAPPEGSSAVSHLLRRYTPHAIVFCSSACIMVVELVAGRLMAPYLGNSLYTWTSIIAVILAGMSLGNVIGGKLADKWPPEQVLGWLFLSSSAISVLTLGVNYLFASALPLCGLDWPLRIFLSAAIVFVPPAVALGTISPAAAKMALARSDRVGATIGSFYAWAVLGSILGTFLTGFWLIDALGARGVVLSTALGLALLGLGLGPQRVVHAAWVCVVFLFLVFSRLQARI